MYDKPSKLRSAIIAGVAIGLLSSVPFINLLNCCCCAWVLLGGILGVFLYSKELTSEMYLETTDALIVGLLAGIVAAVIATFVEVAILLIFPDFHKRLLQAIFDRFAEMPNFPPDAADKMREAMDQFSGESASIGMAVRNLFTNMIIYPIFGLLGSLIGYSIFRRRNQPQQPYYSGPQPPPPGPQQ